MIDDTLKDEKIDNVNIDDTSAESASSEGDPAAEAETDNVSDESFEAGDNSSELSDQAALWQDKYLRLVAEFDNYRKRTLKEKMDLIALGGEDVIKSLLVVLDDMDRAMNAMQTSTDMEAIKQGISLIHQKLVDTMRSKGVEEIEALGLELDTDLHEAVAKFPVEEPQKGKIIDVVQKGYKLKDKVTRFAKVVVGE